MSTIPITPSAFDFGQFTDLRAAASSTSGSEEAGALRRVAQQFEGLFTQMMLKAMRASLPGDSTLGSQGAFYQGIFDQQLSLNLSAGKGLGLADLLVQQLQQSKAAVLPSRAGGQSEATAVQPLGGEAPAGRTGALPALPRHPLPQAGEGKEAWNPQTPDEFVDALRPHAETAARALGVPAEAIVAQAAIETGWGRHLPRHADGRPSFNLFGIKAGSRWDGETLVKATGEYRDGVYGVEKASFRSYASLDHAFGDYVRFLQKNPRYLQALKAGDVQGFAQGLQKAGYASDPEYANKLQRVAQGLSL